MAPITSTIRFRSIGCCVGSGGCLRNGRGSARRRAGGAGCYRGARSCCGDGGKHSRRELREFGPGNAGGYRGP